MARLSITVAELPEAEARLFAARVRKAEALGFKVTAEEYRPDFYRDGHGNGLLGSVSFYLTSSPDDDNYAAEDQDKDMAELATTLATDAFVGYLPGPDEADDDLMALATLVQEVQAKEAEERAVQEAHERRFKVRVKRWLTDNRGFSAYVIILAFAWAVWTAWSLTSYC